MVIRSLFFYVRTMESDPPRIKPSQVSKNSPDEPSSMADSAKIVADVELALRLIAGRELARDFKHARELLKRAADAKHGDAAIILASITAAGMGGPVAWLDAVDILRSAASYSVYAKDDLALVDLMELSPSGYPTRKIIPEILTRRPKVSIVRNFLSELECRHVAMSVADILEPSMIIDPTTGAQRPNPIRTSSGSAVGPTRQSLPIQAILRRIATVTGTNIEHGEPLMVLSYAPGQQYRAHLDAISGEPNQRIRTVILYLNSGYRGGETIFTHTGIKFAAKGGDALIFDNVLPGTVAPDPMAEHAGLPVIEGNKWIATRWIRQNTYDAFST